MASRIVVALGDLGRRQDDAGLIVVRHDRHGVVVVELVDQDLE